MWLSIARAAGRPLRMVGVRRSGALSRVVFLSSTATRHVTATAKKPVAVKKAPAKKPAAKGRAVAAKKPAAKKPAAKKAAPKKAVAKKTAPRKKKAAPKKPVVKKKKTLSPEKQKLLQIRELKRTALLTRGAVREPARRITQAWTIFLTRDNSVLKDQTQGATQAENRKLLANYARERSAKFKALSQAEIEALHQEAELNKQRNETELRQWVHLHSVGDIAAINNARARLRRLGLLPKGVGKINDDRVPKRAPTSWANFVTHRWKSGDFAGQDIPEATKTISAEWKGLSDAEHKAFESPKTA